MIEKITEEQLKHKKESLKRELAIHKEFNKKK